MKKSELEAMIKKLETRISELEEKLENDVDKSLDLYDWFSFYPHEDDGQPFPVVLEWHTLSEDGAHEYHRVSFSTQDILEDRELADAISAMLECVPHDEA